MTESSALFSNRRTVSAASTRAVLIGATLLVCGSATHAQVIARYDFAGGSAAAAEASPSVTAGDYTVSLGTISSSTGTHFINGDLLPPTLTTISEVTITPTVGMLDLTSLDFGYRTDNAEVDDIFDLRVRSSLDGFTADLFSETRTGLTGTTNNPVSVDLTGAAFQGLATPVTFQWVASDNTDVNTERTRIVADVSLLGTVSGGAAELTVTVDRSNGDITLENIGASSLDFVGYSITSNGGLNPASWTSIADTYDVNGSSPTQISPDDWTELTDPADDSDLSEFDFESAAGATLAGAQSISLGVGAWTPSPFETLDFTYVEPGGAEVSPTVLYTGDVVMEGDFDADGDIDAVDWAVVRSNLGGDVTGQSRVARYLQGDLDNNSLIGGGDFLEFKDLFDAANGGGSFAAMLAAPEPTSAVLLGLAACLGLVRREARRAAVAAVALLLAVGLTPAAHAQFSENFDALSVGAAPAQLPGWSFFDLGAVTTDADWQITDDATSGSTFGSLHLSQANTAPDFFQTNQPIAGALAIFNSTDISTVDVIDFDFALGGFGDGSGQFLDTKLIFGFRDVNNFYSMNIVAGQANGTNTELDISTIRVLDGDTDPTRTNVFDTFSTGNFSAGFPASPTVLHGQLIHDSTEGTVSFTISNGATVLFTDSVTSTEFTLDGDIGFGVNNDAVSFDNLLIRELPRLTLQVDPVDGDTQIVNAAGEGIDIDYYEINDVSTGGGRLDPVAWSSLEDQNAAGFPAGDGSGNGWEEGDLSNSSQLIEAYLTSSSVFADTDSVYLGEAVGDGVTDEISWRYHVAGSGSSFINGKVEFVNVDPPNPMIPGDFDGDGDVDVDDFGVFVNSFQMSPQGGPPFAPGDFDEDGDVDVDDFGVFVNSFQNFPPPAVAVPEPSGVGLALLGGLLLTLRRRARAAAAATCVAAAVLAPATSHAIVFDRLLGLGEEEGAAVGPVTGDSFDATAPFVDVSPSGDPQYVSIAGRPGAAGDSSTLGIEFDGAGDYMSGLRFGLPETSRGAIGTTVGTPFGNALNYTGIVNRGMQLWVNPNSAGSGSKQSVIHDTNQFGVLISDAATPTWILQSQGTEFDSGIPVVFDDWTHVAVHRQFGQGNVLLVNGVAVTRTGSTYDGLDTANLVIGSNTAGDELTFSGGTGEFFQGVIDQVELYTWGLSDEGPLAEPAEDHLDFNFGRDNGFARLPLADGGLSGVAGDVNNDGVLDGDDVTAFVAGWQSQNFIPFEEGFGGSANSPVVDINSLGLGDLNFDGQTDISDAFLLHQALVGGGSSTGLDFGLLFASVPEPSTSVLVVGFASLLAARRRR